jgi:gamma-glutamyl-gamma-aminobutyrate hydrolase PuuD
VAKPRIGITRSGSAKRISPSYQPYHERIREAGGEPVDLFPSIGVAPAELIARLDGLLLSGGPDVAPWRFGDDPHPELGPVDEARDALELGLLAEALQREMPVLAICRGEQVLNVGFGGRLLQHIGEDHRAYLEPDPRAGESRWHDVEIEAGSRLAELLGAGRVHTNSRHHQAVPADGVGAGLVVNARAPDGTVEGVEAPDRRWVLGVQWHPERDEVAARFRPLFEAFIAAASNAPLPAGRG